MRRSLLFAVFTRGRRNLDSKNELATQTNDKMLAHVSYTAQPTARLPPPVPPPTHPTADTHPAAHPHCPLLTCYFVVDCFCGNGDIEDDSEVHIGKCNDKCGGSADACGGNPGASRTPAAQGYVNIYSIPSTHKSPDMQDVVEGSNGQSAELLGCYPYAGNEVTEYGGSVVGLAMVTHVMTNEVSID